MQDLHVRILNRVVEVSGGSEKLAVLLKVPHATLVLWTQGKATMPAEIVVKLVDMIVAADLAALTGTAKPLERVMVVDDDPGSAYSLARVLQQLGHQVEIANDGAAAIELARRFRPAVVFLDLRMPGMDGVEVAEQIRSEGLATHIVAATAYNSELERERTLAAGFAAHFLKPVDRRSLETLLTRLH